MRIAISNIAWDVPEDEAVARLLNENGIDAIDIAPGKYFSDFATATDDEIAEVKQRWAERGIEITGMQSLLFGTTGLNVFADQATQNRMLKHLGHVCRIAGGLKSPRLVFGSPRNRDRGGLSDEKTAAVADDFFRTLGDIAAENDVIICLEPNPTRYGANFMTTSPETAETVRRINHPAVKMQLDTGALTINDERAADILEKNADLIGHVHASEPDLVPLGDGGCDHASAGEAVRARLPQHLVSIEMRATPDEPHLQSIGRAVRVARESYGD